jgi:hypothetical protein
MGRSAEHVRVLQEELQGWLVKRNLVNDAKWGTPDESSSGEHLPINERTYLLLGIEREMYNVLWCATSTHPKYKHYKSLSDEFAEIVYRHGFRFDFGDSWATICFKEYYDDATPEEQQKWEAKQREDEDFIEELRNAGWYLDDKGILVHPRDPERKIFFDPYTGELCYSAKQAALIEEELRRQRDDGPGLI